MLTPKQQYIRYQYIHIGGDSFFPDARILFCQAEQTCKACGENGQAVFYITPVRISHGLTPLCLFDL